MDNNAQGKGFLDISLEDVKMSEDGSDIIAGKVTARATGYTNDEEIDPIVLEGSDVSLTGAGGGGGGTVDNGIQSITISPTIQLTPSLNDYLPMSYEKFVEEYPGGNAHLSFTSENIHSSTEYSFTVTPGSEWYVADASDPNNIIFSEKGEPLTISATTDADANLSVNLIAVESASTPGPDSKIVLFLLDIASDK